MSKVTFKTADDSILLDVRTLTGEERLGAPSRIQLEAFSPDPVVTAGILGKACALVFESPHGSRVVYGIATRVVSVLTAQAEPGRKYRITVCSPLAVLELRRRTRVFQELTVPQIVARVLEEGGLRKEDIVIAAQDRYSPRRYVTQYDETDASFVRRLCEEEGLYFRWESGDGADRFVLEDTSSAAAELLGEPLVLVPETALHGVTYAAYGARIRRERQPGKATLRDYDFQKPKLALEGIAAAGHEVERGLEVYEAPGGFLSVDAAKRAAERRLESLRACAEVLSFTTTAIALAPGHAFTIERAPNYDGAARPDGQYFVVSVHREWAAENDADAISVEAIPLVTPYRLPRETARPRALGVHSAIVTGAAGEEIHTDTHARVFVRFPWDREGPADASSSLPVRVMQPNTPGSMAIPRVGWEVFVMFEDGDPDRPFVLGRTYNGKYPPPVSLPKNKTMTSLATYSSPGGGGQNAITFDDGAGRQHFAITAASAKDTTVANDLKIQTALVEKHGVGGSQSRSVGGSETIAVKQAFHASMASQSASVGGSQTVFVKGDLGVGIGGGETVVIGGALDEKVGSAASGAASFAKAAALAGVGSLGRAGAMVAQGAGVAMGAVEGYKHGGAKGAAESVGMSALGHAVGKVPGGDALLASVQGAASPAPWHDTPGAEGEQAAGGGAGGAASDASGAKGPGPGHRNTLVKGAMTELIGASHSVLSPGSIGWKTTGASTFLVGAAHATKTASASTQVLGASVETLGALHVTSGANIGRSVTGPIATTIAGALSCTAGGKHNIKAGGAIVLKVGGSLTLGGSTVTFVCGGSKVSASPGGVLIEAGTITITGPSKQSGKTTHA